MFPGIDPAASARVNLSHCDNLFRYWSDVLCFLGGLNIYTHETIFPKHLWDRSLGLLLVPPIFEKAFEAAMVACLL